jgi:subtilisin family serine protease
VKYVKEDSKESRIPTDEPNPDLVLGEDEIPVGMARIGAPYTGSADLTAIHVAVVDTGVQASHSELNVVAEQDLVCVSSDDCADGTDPQGHGTHVAGTIGARADGEGVVGVAPGVPIHAVRVLGSDGSGYMTDIIAGLEYVYDTPEIRVVNMSLGGPAKSGMDDELEEAVLRLEEAGVFVAIAAGNETQNTDNVIPAAFDLGIVVSAYDTSDGDRGFARFSNFGEQVDIAAPGVDIFSTWPDGGYAALSGTSMATPHVAGAAAAYLARFPDTSPASLRGRMLETAEGDLTGANERHSEGLLDFEALNDR